MKTAMLYMEKSQLTDDSSKFLWATGYVFDRFCRDKSITLLKSCNWKLKGTAESNK